MTEEQAGWQQWALKNLAKIQNNVAFEPGPIDAEPLSAGMHVQPPFDPVETLPPAAAEKLRLLRQRSADAHLLIPPGIEQQELNAERTRARQRLERLQAHPQDGGLGLPPEHASCTAAEKEIARTSENARRLTERSERLAAAWRAAAQPLASCETWLKSGRPGGTTLEDAKEVEPQLHKSETILDGVERLRRRCRELRADLHRLTSAPYPSSHAKAQMRGIIEQLAMQGAPSTALLIEHDRREIGWPMTRLRSEVRGGEHPALAFAETLDAVALLAWLHRDLLIKRLDAEIDAEADDPASLSHADREVRAAEAEADLLATERDICSLIWRGQAEKLPMEFPSDISPVALLGLRLVTTPRSDALPGTSPEHGYNIVGERR